MEEKVMKDCKVLALIHISDNNRNLFKTSKLCRMSPSVTGDDFIFTITQRSYQ